MQSWERAAFVPLDVSFCDRRRISVYGNNRIVESIGTAYGSMVLPSDFFMLTCIYAS